MATPLWRRFGLVWIVSLAFAGAATPVHADEIWVAPTSQADIGGLGVASNVFWPATPVGAVRLAWAIPADLQTFQNARLVLIPSASSPTPVLTFYVCTAQSSQLVTANCAAPVTKGFTSTANQLIEIDVTDAISGHLGAPGASYLSVLAFTAPTTTTDHIVGLRFRYAPAAPAGAAGLAANTFTGTQTAPAFVGDGSGLTNVPVPSGVATLGANTFAGTQTAPAFVGSGAGLTGVARLQANTFGATQTISSGNLDLPNSTSAATGVITLGGVPFLHRFGANNVFLGTFAGNFTMTGGQNTAAGARALFFNAEGANNTASGYHALQNNSSGSYNSAAGESALANNTTGAFNTASGEQALGANTTGFNNTATGQQALGLNTTGGANTGTGQAALNSNSTGSHNTASGYHALFNNTIGTQNTAAGNFALFNNTNGFNNTALGFQAGVGFGNLVNATAIGANAVVSQSNALAGRWHRQRGHRDNGAELQAGCAGRNDQRVRRTVHQQRLPDKLALWRWFGRDAGSQHLQRDADHRQRQSRPARFHWCDVGRDHVWRHPASSQLRQQQHVSRSGCRKFHHDRQFQYRRRSPGALVQYHRNVQYCDRH